MVPNSLFPTDECRTARCSGRTYPLAVLRACRWTSHRRYDARSKLATDTDSGAADIAPRVGAGRARSGEETETGPTLCLVVLQDLGDHCEFGKIPGGKG